MLPSNADEEAISQLNTPPPNWSLEADEELVRFLVDHCKNHDLYIGGASKYVESVTVSTVCFFVFIYRTFIQGIYTSENIYKDKISVINVCPGYKR